MKEACAGEKSQAGFPNHHSDLEVVQESGTTLNKGDFPPLPPSDSWGMLHQGDEVYCAFSQTQEEDSLVPIEIVFGKKALHMVQGANRRKGC